MFYDLEKYVMSWRKKINLEKKKREILAINARKIALNAAQILAEEFEVEKVVLFGSLSRGNFTKDSDIDMAVWKLKSKDYLKALIRIEKDHDFEINLVPYENAYNHIKESIDEGILLYKREKNEKNRITQVEKRN